MSHEIEIPQESAHIVIERSKIWNELDAAKARADELNKLAQGIGGLNGTAEEVKQPLSGGNDPRAEIERVITEANAQLSELGKVNAEISDAKNQIEQIKARAKTTITFMVIGAIVVVGLLFVVLSNGTTL